MIGEIAMVMEIGAFTVDVEKTSHPHPTLGDSTGKAAEVVHGLVRMCRRHGSNKAHAKQKSVLEAGFLLTEFLILIAGYAYWIRIRGLFDS